AETEAARNAGEPSMLSANDQPQLTDPRDLARQPAGCLAFLCAPSQKHGAHRQKNPAFAGSVACLCVEESLFVIIIWSKAQYPTSHPGCIPYLRFLVRLNRGPTSFPCRCCD